MTPSLTPSSFFPPNSTNPASQSFPSPPTLPPSLLTLTSPPAFLLCAVSDGYISWVSDGKKAWTYRGGGMAANAAAGVGPRPVPQEPMYIIINLGLSENFGAIDYEGLAGLWPVHMVSLGLNFER